MAGYEMTIACRDFEEDCEYVARAETEEELITDIKEHAKKFHGYTDKQLNDPKMMKKIISKIKKKEK